MNKKLLFKIGYVLVGLVLIYKIADYFGTQKVESLVKSSLKKSDSIAYKDFSVNFLLGNVTIDKPEFYRDSLTINADKIELLDFSYYDYFKNNIISIDEIKLFKANASGKVTEKDTAKSNKEKSNKNPKKIQIKNINLDDFTIDINQKNGFPLSLEKGNLSMINLQLDSLTGKPKDFTFESITSKLSNFRMQYSGTQTFSVKTLSFENQNLEIDSLQILPEQTRRAYIYDRPFQQDLLTLTVDKIKLPNIKIKNDSIFSFASNFMLIDKANLNVYADVVNQEKSDKIKPLYSKMLRELPFDLHIDSVDIKSSRIQYEELTSNKRKPGVVFFDNISASIKNLSNRSSKANPLLTKIAINSSFMKTSPLRIDWNFDVANTYDTFYLTGKLTNVPNESINSFMEPAIHVKVDGEINKLLFSIIGNHHKSNGDFALNFDNFKINILNDENREKKVLSWLANLFVKDDSKNGLVEVEVEEVERSKNKSFWNFVWKNVEAALKKALL